MDNILFDNLTQRLSTSLSRREGLGLLLGAGLALVGLEDPTRARKKRQKKRLYCFQGQTVKLSKNQADKLKPQGATAGRCVVTPPPPGGCATGQKPCGNTCIPASNCCEDSECAATELCRSGRCSAPGCGTGGTCFVFHTGEAFRGRDLGGLAGADAKCQAAATAAGLPGTYRAWLSGNGQTPLSRFDDIDRAGPYVLVSDPGNPLVVAEDIAQMLDCSEDDCLYRSIDRTETGETLDGVRGAWTGTLGDGSESSDTCDGWVEAGATLTGLTGSNAGMNSMWTSGFAEPCNGSMNHLYCFQQAE